MVRRLTDSKSILVMNYIDDLLGDFVFGRDPIEDRHTQ